VVKVELLEALEDVDRGDSNSSIVEGLEALRDSWVWGQLDLSLRASVRGVFLLSAERSFSYFGISGFQQKHQIFQNKRVAGRFQCHVAFQEKRNLTAVNIDVYIKHSRY